MTSLGTVFSAYVRIATLLSAALVLVVGASRSLADDQEAILRGQRNANAIQSIYRSGVPHTDRRGRLLTTYDPERSFLQVGIWGVPPPTEYLGRAYQWETLKAAGFNTVWPWYRPEEALAACLEHGMQAVLMGPLDDGSLMKWKDHPSLLANCWRDEPALYPGEEAERVLAEFLAYKEKARTLAPDLPVFANLVPWIMPPAASWWGKWTQACDIACHDNYPIRHTTARPRSISADPNGIAQTVSFGIATTHEQKPLWLIVGAFADTQPPGAAFPFRFPTPEQLRACVYEGIIHGATGIIYFTWDTWIPRDGGVIGMSPDPQVAYVPNPQQPGYTRPSPATPMQLAQSRACWEAAAQINRELAELTPVILSPTVGADVKYAVNVEGEAPIATPLSCLLKPHPEGGYVLLTVNSADTVLKATYNFARPLEQVATIFDNRGAEPGIFAGPLRFTPGETSFTLMYEPFDTHIVRVSVR